ncbi:uncharacterized protein LOC115986792 [Quercus lobata]|uniref:uncharacterized protein LOC115986792 n=1 Tax=Quercus lobata TaxID=97700 RepID=UPI001247C057|nr:uncharacterized protein LOC115986792 [Quercus lobata]
MTLETSPQEQQHIDSDNYSLDCDGSFLDGFSDVDSWSDNEEITNTVFDEDNKLSSLMSMGYTRDEASIAMERCGVYFSVMHILKWFSFFLIFVLIMSYLVKM